MTKNIAVKCECNGTGFVAARGGEDVGHVECGAHHPAYKRPSVDEMLQHIGKVTGLDLILERL